MWVRFNAYAFLTIQWKCLQIAIVLCQFFFAKNCNRTATSCVLLVYEILFTLFKFAIYLT